MTERRNSSPNWSEVLHTEINRPYYIYRIGDNPFAIENRFGTAVLFTLMNSSIPLAELTRNVENFPNEPSLRLVLSLVKEGIILKDTSYDWAAEEARKKAAKAVATFDAFRTDPNYNHPDLLPWLEYKTFYDYSPHGLPIKSSIDLVKSPHEDNMLLLIAPVATLMEDKGFPALLLSRGEQMNGSLIEYVTRLGLSPEQVLKEITDIDGIIHIERALGKERIEEISTLSTADIWLGPNKLYRDEDFLSFLLKGVTLEEMDLLKIPKSYSLLNPFAINGLLTEGTSSAIFNVTIEIPLEDSLNLNLIYNRLLLK